MSIPIIDQGYSSGLCYWDGSAWQRWEGLSNPLPVSLPTPNRTRLSNYVQARVTGVGTGGNVNVTLVSTGASQWIFLQTLLARDATSAITAVRLKLLVSGNDTWIDAINAPAAGVHIVMNNPIVVGPSCAVFVQFAGTILADSLEVHGSYYDLS